ncbi:PEPxxWA-CTERM sorting domain-containing protein, partial [Phenylobacterium sp.]|uniref:PEPxxWA-CTERM sorting domain-containing protein n=1 Tax=Phenylobacterium sp. TaxID=1871053 RepID=UPI0025DA99D6
AAAVASALTGGVAAQARTIVFDDFEGYGDVSQADFTGFAHLTVTAGSVSYVDESDSGLTTPYGHGMVDTDGSSGNPGVFRTPEVALLAGTKIRWEFDAAGNGRSGVDNRRMGFVSATTPYQLTDVRYDFGNGFQDGPDISNPATKSYFFNLPTFQANTPWTHFVLEARLVTDATIGVFVADPVNGPPGDNQGMLLDNVRFTAAPEPGVWALMIAGFGLAGARLRRREARAA